jgi:hypothetical protein
VDHLGLSPAICYRHAFFGATMKRKYGAALARETEAEKAQRLRAREMRDNSHNYGSDSRKGAVSRGKKRGRAYRAGG